MWARTVVRSCDWLATRFGNPPAYCQKTPGMGSSTQWGLSGSENKWMNVGISKYSIWRVLQCHFFLELIQKRKMLTKNYNCGRKKAPNKQMIIGFDNIFFFFLLNFVCGADITSTASYSFVEELTNYSTFQYEAKKKTKNNWLGVLERMNLMWSLLLMWIVSTIKAWCTMFAPTMQLAVILFGTINLYLVLVRAIRSGGTVMHHLYK